MEYSLLWLAAALGVGAQPLASGSSSVPNILFVLVDDLGWNDVSYHGASDFETPRLDELAASALELNNYYVQAFCTPTRSALMSGRYPMRDGLQQWIIRSSAGYGMPLELTTLPQELKAGGYSTHLIGKWHLGFFDPAYTPTHRGFDSFLGYYGDKEEYFLKNNSEWAVFPRLPVDESLQRISGFDFRNNTEPFLSEEYSTYLYGAETIRLLEEHVAAPDADPMFILLSSQAAHEPYDAPQDVIDQFSYISDSNRQELAAVIYCFDQTLGDIVDYLQSEESGNLWDQTLVIVSTDNGGTVTMGSSNFPLRGGKKTLWEGGVKATAFVTGGWLPDRMRGQEMNALMHVTDWLPTLCAFAGISPSGTLELDGYDQSNNIVNGAFDPYHPREEILHNVVMHNDVSTDGTTSACYDEFCGAIRWRDYKLVVGTESNMKWSDDEDTMCTNSWCQIAEPEETQTATILCSADGDNSQFPTLSEHSSCVFNRLPCLFNVVEDPCEWNDLRTEQKHIVEVLSNKLKEYNMSQAFPLFRAFPENASLADPSNLDGFWGPWINLDDDSDSDSDEAVELGMPKMDGPDRERAGHDEHVFSMNAVPRETAVIGGDVLVVVMVTVAIPMAVAVLWWMFRRQRDYKRIEDGQAADTLQSAA